MNCVVCHHFRFAATICASICSNCSLLSTLLLCLTLICHHKLKSLRWGNVQPVYLCFTCMCCLSLPGVSSRAVLMCVCVCVYPPLQHCSMLEYDSENLNSEEIYSSLRGVTEAIQNFSFRSQEDLMELRRDGKRDGVVRRKKLLTSWFILTRDEAQLIDYTFTIYDSSMESASTVESQFFFVKEIYLQIKVEKSLGSNSVSRGSIFLEKEQDIWLWNRQLRLSLLVYLCI